MTAPAGERTVIADPRLRARRRRVRRDLGRRRLRRLQVALGTFIVVVGAWGLTQSALLDVDQVEVTGADRTDLNVLVEASGIRTGEAMAWLDVEGAVGSIEALAWVDTATVTRHWPGRVDVAVRERQPLAVVAAAGGAWVVVDERGRQLEVVGEDAVPGLPRIHGLALVPAIGATLGPDAHSTIELARRLRGALPAERSVEVALDGGLTASVGGGSDEETTVRFGRPDDLEAKVAALQALVRSGVLDEIPRPDLIDVQVPSAPAVSRPTTPDRAEH